MLPSIIRLSTVGNNVITSNKPTKNIRIGNLFAMYEERDVEFYIPNNN